MSVLSPTPEAIAMAGKVIRDGGVVVMPTETVYGLACNGLDPQAVQRVYEIKSRPSENPLILHLSSLDQLSVVASSWPPIAEKLAKKFWPGPMTLVLPKSDRVPDITTGGNPTVAVRIPAHPIARAIIEAAQCPVAAPSANVFMGLSPTDVNDIDPIIQLEVETIIDGGPCEIGLESTVIDLTSETPVILRPGLVTRADIQAVLGHPLGHMPPNSMRNSPGMYRRHYAPKARVILVEELKNSQAGLTFNDPENTSQVRMPRDPRAYAATLYSALRKLDEDGCSEIYVATPPTGDEWEAANDRLAKASSNGTD